MRKLNVKLGFVLLTLLIAGLYSRSPQEFFSWVIVLFVSVLFHELGHALTASMFGKSSLIELSFLGGTTYFRQEGLKRWQFFLIAMNGPLFGFLLFILSSKVLTLVSPQSIYAYGLGVAVFINLFWTVFNLLPILPLDGGQLLRITLESIFKNKGLFLTGVVSTLFSCVLALIAFVLSQFFIGSILFLFAFQNFELARQARYLSSSDQAEHFKKDLQDIAFLFETGRFNEAMPLLKDLREKTKQGMIYHQATAMICVIMRMQKDYKGIYEMLKGLPKLYETDLSPLMHEAAFFENDMPLVDKLSSEAFQKESTMQTAYHAAIASASLKNDDAAIGWLKTAIELGLNEDEIKAHPMLKSYANKL
jgi:stage IV sporulation protein FB